MSIKRRKAKDILRSLHPAARKVTLHEAEAILGTTTINRIDRHNKSLARDLNYLLACSRGAEYDSMAFRAVTLNIFNYQRQDQPYYYCATRARMDLCGPGVETIAWHCPGVSNDHVLPLHAQYAMLQQSVFADAGSIYKAVANWNCFLAVTKEEDAEMDAQQMPVGWDGDDLFGRVDDAGLDVILMYPGVFRKIPKNWQVG